MEINGSTQVACLIGHPVSHSFSPYIHHYLIDKYKLNLKYVCFDVAEGQVKEALQGIKALNIIGSNVTIPHKVTVLESLDRVDKNAALIGAVNTIKNESGKLVGYNTDGRGFVKSVIDAGHQIKGKTVMILGAGGASRAISIEMACNGAKTLILRNHTLSKAEAIKEVINANFKQVQVEIGDLEVKEEELKGVDLLINTTPLGMGSNRALCPISEAIVPPSHLVVCDIVYNPQETLLLKWAKHHHLKVVYGVHMLINQAIESFSIWTGIEVQDKGEILELLKEKGVIPS